MEPDNHVCKYLRVRYLDIELFDRRYISEILIELGWVHPIRSFSTRTELHRHLFGIIQVATYAIY